MVLFDYMVAGQQISYKDVILLLVGILFAIGIFGHSKIFFTSQDSRFICPLNWIGFSFVLHVIFLFILLELKAKSLYAIEKKNSIKARRFKK